MLIYTIRFISFPDDYGNTLKHRVEIRCVYWKQHDTCFCRNSTVKTKMKGNRPIRCLDAVISFLTSSSVSFQKRVGLDFCEIYLAEIIQKVGKEGRMRIRLCLQNNSHFPPRPPPHGNMRYQWQKVMQIIAIIISAVSPELGSSKGEGDKLDFVQIPFMENSNIAKSGTRAVNSRMSQRK